MNILYRRFQSDWASWLAVAFIALLPFHRLAEIPLSAFAISLAFLAPGLVKAAIEGRLPHGMGVARLCDLPAEWSRQYQVLGLPQPKMPIRTGARPNPN